MDQGLEGKWCNKCKEIKPLSEYSKDRSHKDGLKSQCKACIHEYYQANKDAIAERMRGYREANRDVIAKRRRGYYQANRGACVRRRSEYYQANKTARIECQREYREVNKDAIAKRRRRRYQANKGVFAERMRGYYQANRNAYVKYQHARRARIADLPGSWSIDQWETLCSFFQSTCPACGEPVENFTVDHVIPISWPNATNDIGNIQPLCFSCNSSKGNRSDADYRPWQVVKWAYGQAGILEEWPA